MSFPRRLSRSWVFLIPYVAYTSLKSTGGIPYLFFVFAVSFWLLVGSVQLLIDASFLQFILYREQSISDLIESGRGVTSLAPEPTFYGIICVFLAIINQLCFRNEKYYKWILLACLFQIFVINTQEESIYNIFHCENKK